MKGEKDEHEVMIEFNKEARSEPEPPSWRKYIPHVVLCAHILENTAAMLQVRFSKAAPVQYIPSVACILVEFFKTIMALTMVIIQEKSINPEYAFPWIYPGGMKNFLRLSVPSILYTISANLVHYGMAILHVPLFQVLYNFRIIATVIISSFLFSERRYSTLKWIACCSLFIGIVIGNLDPFFSSYDDSTTLAPTHEAPTIDFIESPSLQAELSPNTSQKNLEFRSFTKYEYILAAAAVLFAGISTASAGVFSEKLLKETMASMSPWMRNVQFGTLGVIYTSCLALKDYQQIIEKGFFYGFTYQVFLMTLNQAIGGLIVALVLFYLDSVIRTFAGSVSFLLCVILSAMFMQFEIHLAFFIGSIIIICSTYLFSIPDGSPLIPKFLRFDSQSENK